MRRHDEDEDWEAEAVVTYAAAAESEFARLKLDLKRKAGLLPLPLHKRILHRCKVILERLRRFCGRYLRR